MKLFFNKITGVFLVLVLVFTWMTPVMAQDLFDTLDPIKDRLNEDGVEVVDYSTDRQWGNLNADLIDLLEASGYQSLQELADEAGYDPAIGNQTALVNLLVDQGFSNADVNVIVDEVRFSGESQVNTILLEIVKVIRNLLGAFAILFIVVSGVQLVTANGEESKITESRQGILYALLGLGVVLLLERGVWLIFGAPGQERGIGADQIVLIDAELAGIISFIRAILGALALFMIIVSAFRMLAAQGQEDEIKKQRQSIIWVIVGIVLVIINQFVVDNLFIDPVRRNGGQITISNAQNLINLFGTVMQFFLGFLGVVAFGILVYGGASLVMNYSNDEMVDRAKKIIMNAIIGLVIVLTAFAIVATLVTFQ